MPIFEYKCNKCNTKFKKLVSSASADIFCPNCNAYEVKKLFSTFATSGTSSGRGGSCARCSSSSCSSCGH